MSSSSGRVRSKNGCITCKKRRKKCDETHPICERCKKAGMQCLGYDSAESEARPVRRSRAAARLTSGGNSRNSGSIPGASSSTGTPPTIKSPSDSASPTHTSDLNQPRFLPLHDGDLFITADERAQAISLGYSENNNTMGDVFDFSFMSPSLSNFTFSPQFGGDPSTWDANLLQNDLGPWVPGQSEEAGAITSGSQSTPRLMPSLPDQQSSLALYKPPAPPDTSRRMTSGQASLLNALFSLGPSTMDRVMSTPGSTSTPPSTNGSTWPSPETEEDLESETSEESDPEGIRQIVCGTPTLEPTVQSNSLPFVLYSYATMATRTIYEPLKMAGFMKGWLTERFNRSQESRSVVTTVANIFHIIWGTRASATDYIPMATRIATEFRQKVIQESSSFSLAAQNEVQKVRALGDALEIITLQFQTDSFRNAMDMMSATAPLFRSACPEAAHELIDLSAKLTHPDICLRHYAVIDVILSVTTLRPMQFRYNTHFDKDFRDREDFGMQWFNGIPGEFILIMARINMLLSDRWANVSPDVIAEMEQQLQDFKSVPGKSPDAYLMVARLAVQECWKLAVLIFLYMCLGSANAQDPRVEKAQRSFMRVLDRTKPSRTPDVFLLAPLNIVGRVTYRPRERDIIRQRLLNLQECSHPGTCGNDAVRILENVWARADAEGRPAVWSDARVATLAVCGI